MNQQQQQPLMNNRSQGSLNMRNPNMINENENQMMNMSGS